MDNRRELKPFEEKLEDTKEVFRSRRTGNTMVKGKRTTGQTTIYKTIRKNLGSSITSHTENGSERGCSGRVSMSCSTGDTRRATRVTTPVISQELGKDRFVIT